MTSRGVLAHVNRFHALQVANPVTKYDMSYDMK